MRSIRSLLGLSEPAANSEGDTATVRRIAEELERLDPEEARYVASFAYVLARVAGADLEVSEREVKEMERIVGLLADLSDAQTALIVQIAKHQALHLGGTEDYVVTRQFRELATRDQRLGMLRCLFALAAADENVSHEEDQEISQIATELALTTAEVSAVRSTYREQLAVLRKRP